MGFSGRRLAWRDDQFLVESVVLAGAAGVDDSPVLLLVSVDLVSAWLLVVRLAPEGER